MRILIGKTFGLGNAVMSIPMIKALKSMSHSINVLIGSTNDDSGALDVFRYLHKSKIIDHVYIDSAIDGDHDVHDVAIMSIPFDGRWRNGMHYNANKVMDGRTRPDPSTTGLVSWKKHEVEYQMDNAYQLGYKGEVPDCSFYESLSLQSSNVYLGVGYKKDAAGFWKQKHWGNENFIELIKLMLNHDCNLKVWATGDTLDWNINLKKISDEVNDPRFIADITSIDKAFDIISKCSAYIGNDTGVAHVAASMGLKTLTYLPLENSFIKNRPWRPKSYDKSVAWRESPSPDTVFMMYKELL